MITSTFSVMINCSFCSPAESFFDFHHIPGDLLQFVYCMCFISCIHVFVVGRNCILLQQHQMIWFLSRLERLVEQDCEVGGISLKKGTYVSAMIYGMHHDAEIWPDPETFDPDRYG